MLMSGSAYPTDFDKGTEAYSKGDFKTALAEWRPLAKQGDAEVQFNLGLMYEQGLGVPQDDKEAVKWYRLATKVFQKHSTVRRQTIWDR
jgi:hypothetical protein